MTGRIDAHLHIWSDPSGYPWLDEQVAPINRPCPAEEARVALDRLDLDEAIVVQAADTDTDTDHLLAAASAHDWIIGVVGWLPLDNPEALDHRLATMAGREHLDGVRQLIHDQPDRQFLARPGVRRSAKMLASAGLPLEVPDAFPEQLPAAIDLAGADESLVLVLDHLGKPPVRSADPEQFDHWAAQVRRFAEHPATVAKVSGLHHGGRLLAGADLACAIEVAMSCFGAERLMLGSDWPMPLLGDGLDALAAQLSEIEHLVGATAWDQLTVRTARRVYRGVRTTEAGEC